jgi:hypothetical protein
VHFVSDPERVKVLRQLGFDLSDDDFQAVAAESRGKRGGHRFARAFSAALLSHWTRKDPQSAAALFRDLPRDEEPDHPYDQIVDGKTGNEFPSQYRYSRLRDVIVAWSRRDPAAAGAFLTSVSDEDRESLRRCVQARLDPEGLSATLLTLEGKERALAMRALADAWGEKNPRQALRWGEQLPIPSDATTPEGYLESQLRADFVGTAVRAWARSSAEEALSWVLASPDHRWLAIAVAEEVAKTDPKAAVAIVDRNLVPPSPNDGALYDMALAQLAFLDPDPEAGADMLQAHRPGSPSGPAFETLRHFVKFWAEDDDADAAMRWAAGRSDPKIRNWLVMAAAVGRVISADPDVVGAMAALKTLPEDLRARGADDILSAYARQHPSDAASVARSFQQPLPVLEIAEELARQDLDGALTWARSVTDASARDKAFCDLAAGPLGLCWQAEDVSRAIALAAEISDPSIRLHTQGRIASYWASRSEPGPVLDWVLSLPGDKPPSPKDQKDWVYHTKNSRKEILDSIVAGWADDAVKREAAWGWIERSSLPEKAQQSLFRKLEPQKK